MSKNVFQKIIDGDIPTDRIFENEYVIAFKDINPISQVHILIVPKKFYVNVDDVPENEMIIFSHIMSAAKKIASKIGVSGSYKVLTNVGVGAGQSVFHMHFHLISGKNFSDREL